MSVEVDWSFVFCSAYLPVFADCSSPEERDEFCQVLSRLLLSVRSMDVLVVAGDFSDQLFRNAENVMRRLIYFGPKSSGDLISRPFS